MNLNHFYHYYKSKSGGLSNLLLGSEELEQSDQGEWVRYNMNAVNADQVNNPSGTEQTAEQLDFEASRTARIAQTVTLTAGTEYTFSVWARAASGTEPFRLRYWDNVGGSGGGSAFTASATWSASTGRYEMTFTAQNSGTFQVFIQNAADGDTRRIYFWGAMLNVGATALDYVKTEFPAGPSNPPTAPMEFGDNFAGVTAYYSLRRFTKGEDNNAIRVRRSSDDTEQDIGFDANGDLDTTALTTFVNADVDTYTSDFSITEDLSEFNGTGAAAQSVGGVDDAYKFTLTGAGGLAQKIGVLSANTFNVSLDYYIPSTNTYADGILIRTNQTGDGSYQQSVTDAWTSVNIQDWDILTGNTLRIYATDGGSITTAANNDVFYLKNIVVTQTTADGAVTTFYDQSGNGNNATNATASEQPLVVSGGALVTEGGKAAILPDGVDDVLIPSNTSVTIQSLFMVSGNPTTGYQIGAEFYIVSQNSILRWRSTDSSTGFNVLSASHRLSSIILSGSSNPYSARGFLNGQAASNNPLSKNIMTTFQTIGDNSGTDASLQEIIIFDSDQSSNRTTMETNINDHFDIYTP